MAACQALVLTQIPGRSRRARSAQCGRTAAWSIGLNEANRWRPISGDTYCKTHAQSLATKENEKAFARLRTIRLDLSRSESNQATLTDKGLEKEVTVSPAMLLSLSRDRYSFCERCGLEVRRSASFCRHCGASVEFDGDEESLGMADVYPEKKGPLLPILADFIFALVFAALTLPIAALVIFSEVSSLRDGKPWNTQDFVIVVIFLAWSIWLVWMFATPTSHFFTRPKYSSSSEHIGKDFGGLA
jgi:hypothetical protein